MRRTRAAAPAPRRIQLRRTKGWRLPAGAVVVARPTKWGNPFRVDVFGREEAVTLYRFWLEGRLDPAFLLKHRVERPAPSAEDIRAALAGKDLACWCPLLDREGRGVPCHADVLLRVAGEPS